MLSNMTFKMANTKCPDCTAKLPRLSEANGKQKETVQMRKKLLRRTVVPCGVEIVRDSMKIVVAGLAFLIA
jgi:hypothetical protein